MSTAGAIGGVGNFYFTIMSPTQIRVTNWFDKGESLFVNLPAGSTDILVRVQRSFASRRWSVQTWSADGGQRFSSSIGEELASRTINLAADIVVVTGNVQWAWLRVFKTTIPMDSPAPSQAATPSILAYEFEGNGNDSSGNLQNLSSAGTPTYVSTPVKPQLGEARTVRAGRPFPLDCSGTDASTYAWQQLSGPATLTFSDPNSGRTTVTGADKFGQYEVQCKATNLGSALTGMTVLRLGAVETSDNGIVVPPSKVLSMLLGPMLRADVTEWTWYDRTRRETGDFWATATRDYTADMTSVEGENYYDSALVQYQNYYRTGFTRHLTLAQGVADRFYTQFFKPQEIKGGCASNFIAPRNASLIGLLIRTTESSDTAKWKCLTDYASYAFTLWVENRGTDKGYRLPYYGTREAGFALISMTALAEAHPNEDVRKNFAARITTALTTYFRGHQCLSRDKRQECLANYTAGTGTISVTKGSTAVTGNGTSFSSFLKSGNRLSFRDQSTGVNYNLAVLRVQSDSRLTLAEGFGGESLQTNAKEWARNTQDGLRAGGYRSDDPTGGVLGWFD